MAAPQTRVLILGMTPLADQLLREITARPACQYTVVGVLDDTPPAIEAGAGRLFAGQLSRLPAIVDELKPDHIVVAFAERRGRVPTRALVDTYVSRGVNVEEITEFYERLTGKLAIEWLTPMRVIGSGKFHPSPAQRRFARVLSWLVAVIALFITSPLFALIALAIKLDSRGPVFFKQQRVGLQGRPFTLLKFRSMSVDRRRRSEWEGDNRDHVTRVGRWLRRFRLDELPQFVNILRGEMNLVGPRPHPVTNLELLTLVARNLNEVAGAAFGCYALRLVVPPGLTGWAQVRYRYANNVDEEIEKLRYDLHYIKHMTPWLDLQIAFETVAVMVTGKSSASTEPAPSASTVRAYGLSRKVLARIGLLGMLLLFAAPAGAQDTPRPDVSGTATADYEYVIGPADVIEVAVWQNVLISRTVPVRPDGKISLPVINDVQAAGLTPSQLQAFLNKALASYMQTPEVSVIVREVHSFNVSVIGNVTKPGRYSFDSRITVLDALALAGGLTEYADRGKVVILRRIGAKSEPLPFAYDKVASGSGSSQLNFFIQPDDIILVR
jgi:exopolysaccharide biosynthesis polyprenyl glycosylphosphotransferase